MRHSPSGINPAYSVDQNCCWNIFVRAASCQNKLAMESYRGASSSVIPPWLFHPNQEYSTLLIHESSIVGRIVQNMDALVN